MSINTNLLWEDFLNVPVFIINLDRKPTRFQKCIQRVKEAGFKNISRIRAVDGMNDNLKNIWVNTHNDPKFNKSDGKFNDIVNHPHHQAIMLSHMNILKKIINETIDIAIIFEDDVIFHKDWNILAPKYYEVTPKNYDMLYMGHHCGYGFGSHVGKVPVFCLQAYVITYNGANILYNKILNDPSGVSTIDCMIWNYMCSHLQANNPFLNWYVWNGEFFPDEFANIYEEYKCKDKGLIFQEYDGNKYDDYIL